MSVDPTNGKNNKRQVSRADAAYPRKRALQACQTCRVRRTKCDNARPSCAACQTLGAECVYREKDHSSFDQGTLAILERLDNLEATLFSSSARDSQQLSPAKSSGHDSHQVQPAASASNLGSPVLLEEVDSFPHSITVEGVLSWPLWNGQFATGSDLKHLLAISRHDYSSPHIGTAPIENDFIDEDRLVQNYFQTFHIFNPVLDDRKIADYRRGVQLNGYGMDAKSCLLLLVYALGYVAEYDNHADGARSSSDWNQSPLFRKADSCFNSAQRRFGQILCSSGVLEAQCLFLAGVYLMSNLQPLEAWRLFVQAVACCQSFHPFHEQAREMSADDEYEKGVQDSIVWTCFKSELELRLELRISEIALRDFKYPAFFPSPPKDLAAEGEPAWFFYLAEIALQRLKGRMLYHVYKYQISGLSIYEMEGMVLNFEHQAREWMSSLPPNLALDSDPAERSPKLESLRLILRSHLLDCFEVMYWPFLEFVLNENFTDNTTSNPSPNPNLTISLHPTPRPPPSPSIISFARKLLDVCIDRIEQTSAGFHRRHHGTWLTLRSCTRSALVLLAVNHHPVSLSRENFPQSRENLLSGFLPQRWEKAVEKVVELLGFWEGESGDARERAGILAGLLRAGRHS